MHGRLGSCLLLLATLSLAAAEPEPADGKLAEAAKALPAHLESDRPLLFIPKLVAPKDLTGDMKDPVWAKAASLNMVAIDGDQIIPAKLPTTASIFCTDDALLFGIHADDPDSSKCVTSFNEPWQNDSIECFLYAGESSSGGKLYYQIAIDVDKKTRFIHAHMYPLHNWRRLEVPWSPSIDCEVAKGKDDKGWTMEFKVKFSDLDLTEDAKAKKSLWRLHLTRNRPNRGDMPEQSYAWMPTDKTRQNHLPWRWGYIIPEQYASPELIAAVVERGKGLTGAAAPSSETLTRVSDAVLEFNSDDFATREGASRRIITLIDRKRTMALAVQDLLKKTVATSSDSEVKFRAIQILRACHDIIDPDDDPLPPELNF